jgi:hypothetical protein
MSMVKRWLEDLSVEMGLDGEITDEVMAEGEKRLKGKDDVRSEPFGVPEPKRDSGRLAEGD